jgi:GNAT superfamily N-acetyltransferase
MELHIARLSAEDRRAWELLARGYKAFYQTEIPPSEYEAAWNRLQQGGEVQGLGAKINGELVGIAHYLFHASTWAPTVCYLQDLFVAEHARGRGVARALIEAVAAVARERGARRYYWHTKEQNSVARALYDKVARFHGFIRYEVLLEPTAGDPPHRGESVASREISSG